MILEIIKNQGLRYFIFRLWYEFKIRTGILKKDFPNKTKILNYISFEDWKKLNIPFLFSCREDIKIVKRNNYDLENCYNKIRNGSIRFFGHEWKEVSEWNLNIDSGYEYDMRKHWTQVQDLSHESGDIKYVWEKSRFTYLQDVMRYDYHFQKDSSDFVFAEIEDWINSNPLNMGPNYKCSQEISLRCLNWFLLLFFYKNSITINEEIWQKIIHSLNWQIKHVYSNINFSRISVRNNHAITECLTLFISGLLLPFLKDSSKWLKKGKKWFEEEIDYQIYDDGTFLQFSHNYQRVVTQLLTLGISISSKHDIELSAKVISKTKKLIKYMDHCCVGKDGQMPNYGNNDGALFFKFSNQDFIDFRPQINALHCAIYSTCLYSDDSISEEAEWFGYYDSLSIQACSKKSMVIKFNIGGIYTISDKSDNSFTFFKCAKYKDRPSQADNMHLDIWLNGLNYLRDSGTYKYNTDEKFINYFAGTTGHNTIVVNGNNQMTKGPRFIWYDWTKNVKVNISQQGSESKIDAEAEMFYSLPKSVLHKRTIVKSKPNHWLVIDKVIGKEDHIPMVQSWQVNPELSEMIEIKSFNEKSERINLDINTGNWSEYYGLKDKIPLWQFVSIGDEFHTEIIINPKS